MIILTLLAIILVVALVVMLVFGAAFILVFGDLIVAMAVIVGICKLIGRNKRRRMIED